MKKRIAILASGEGTNAENIIHYFLENESVSIELILCNRKEAGVYARAERLGVPSVYVPKSLFLQPGHVLNLLVDRKIDFVVLAGFLLFVPEDVIGTYEKRIVNIHPSLLPRHGGKGMYGDLVHESVIASGDKESGITIHYVNEQYDAGEVIFQARVPVLPGDGAEDVASKIHVLEYEHYPRIIEKLLLG